MNITSKIESPPSRCTAHWMKKTHWDTHHSEISRWYKQDDLLFPQSEWH